MLRLHPSLAGAALVLLAVSAHADVSARRRPTGDAVTRQAPLARRGHVASTGWAWDPAEVTTAPWPGPRPDGGLADPCLRCDALYSSDGSGRLFEVDPEAGTSTLIGSLPTVMFDIAASGDGRLFGVSGSGQLYEIDACDASATLVGGAGFGFVNGLGGQVGGGLLYTQGPPLGAVDTLSGFAASTIGGSIGGGPPGWCGGSSGDLAQSPVDGLLYSTLGCFGACGPADALVTIDPATGDVLAEIGCLVDDGGSAISAAFGVAFDACGTLWLAAASGATVYEVDTSTAAATSIAVGGGFNGTFGMASVPCPSSAADCGPKTQGFWKRQCTRAHPSGEHEMLGAHVGAVGASETFAGLGTVEELCAELTPSPRNEKCEQAEAQLLALLLNLASGRLSPCCCVVLPDGTTSTAGEVATAVDALLARPLRSFADCVRAQGMAAALNEAASLCD